MSLASKLLEEFTDASMSDCAIHEALQQTGSLDVLRVCPDAAEIQDRMAQAAAGRKWRPIVVLAVDAALVPSRPHRAKGTRPGRKKSRARRRRWQGEYREAKGFRFYLVDDERIVHLISWHQMGDEQAFGAALRQVKEAGLIPEDQVRLCALADGAPWIWKWVEELFPSARQVLDSYHCSSYLHAVAEAQYGADPARAAQWLEATLARLFCDEGAGVVWGLQRMQPDGEEADEAITSALSYLQKRLHQVDFGSHRKGGYPIGSGAIESAHRFIGQVRLKRSGAWCMRKTATPFSPCAAPCTMEPLIGSFSSTAIPSNDHRNRNNQLRLPLPSATYHSTMRPVSMVWPRAAKRNCIAISCSFLLRHYATNSRGDIRNFRYNMLDEFGAE